MRHHERGVANKPRDTFRHYPPHPLSYIIVSPGGPNDPRARVYRAARAYFSIRIASLGSSLSPPRFLLSIRQILHARAHARTDVHIVRDTVRYFTSANNRWWPGSKGRNNRRICGRRRLRDRRGGYIQPLFPLSQTRVHREGRNTSLFNR